MLEKFFEERMLSRADVVRALHQLDERMPLCSGKSTERIKKLKTYITNNQTKIVNNRERQKNGLIFTSNLPEATVKNCIIQRCKGQQHMRWSREGLQLRAVIVSNDWDKIWKTAVMNPI